MKYDIVRVLRTPHSERFVLRKDDKDMVAVDLHYLLGGTVAGTVVFFEGSGMSESDIPATLKFIDEALLPEVKIENDDLFFTVVIGKVAGSFTPVKE